MAAVFLGAAPAAALEVVVASPGEMIADSVVVPAPVPAMPDTLVASFRLLDLFRNGERLGDGIPATLTFVIDLWRDRSGWWDSLARNRAFTYRFRHDLLSGTYEVQNVDGSTTVLADREGLRRYLERVHEVTLALASHLEAGQAYYVTVKAVLQPMDLEELRRMDAWFSGDVSESGGGGVLGVPKGLARILVDVTGLGDRTALGRSRPFTPRPLP
jgi:hypothetical protein